MADGGCDDSVDSFGSVRMENSQQLVRAFIEEMEFLLDQATRERNSWNEKSVQAANSAVRVEAMKKKEWWAGKRTGLIQSISMLRLSLDAMDAQISFEKGEGNVQVFSTTNVTDRLGS